ncbi:MAG: substrate-binding domain-containing protein [Pseudomonadota bacterium]
MKRQISVLAMAAALGFAAGPGFAQTVTLTSQSTGFVLEGQLLEFDGTDYTIVSSIGRLTVPGDDMICEGADCPALGGGNATSGASGFDTAFGVVGSNAIGTSLMPTLIEAYSFALGGEAEREVGGSDASVFRLRDATGTEVAAINLSASDSSAAFPGLINGDALIGMSSRPARDTEMLAFENAGLSPINQTGTEHILALDGLVIIVSPDNPIQSVNIVDAAEIFAGSITNWAALGGPDAPINLYVPDPQSGGAETFQERVLAPLGERLTGAARVVASNRDLADAVAADRFGIGFTGMAFERSARALDLELPCGIIVEPNEFNVKTEEYPLSRRLFLYTTGQPLPRQARELLDFALSDDAQIEIADIGFVNQSVASISLNDQGRRIAEAFIQPRDPEAIRMMRDMALELLDADRLSTTFRFQTNSSVLDVKSEGDLLRLARHIASGALRDKEIILIGFADDVDRFEANIALSSQRAGQLRASLEAELSRLDSPETADIVTIGFGPLAPVACEDEGFNFGSVSNRRVEVWVRDRF